MVLPYLHELFVDRDDILDFLLDLIDKINNNTVQPNKRVVHIFGHSKKGKTWLLKEFKQRVISQKNKSIPILISFEGFVFSNNNDTTDSFSRDVLTRIANEVGFPAITEDLPLQSFSQDLSRYIEKVKKEEVIVFIFDEVSLLTDDFVYMLEDHVLAPMLYLQNSMFIIAGRKKVSGFKDFNLRPDRDGDNIIELPGFLFEHTHDQIQKRNPSAVHLDEKIFEFTEGSPGKVDIILNQAVGGYPLELYELKAAQVCNGDLIETIRIVSEKLPRALALELMPALEALCILQDFDKEYEAPVLFAAHKNLNGNWDVKRSTTLFSILTNIQIGPGKLIDWDLQRSAHVIEGQTRTNLEQELKLRDKELWETLHCAAMKMYQAWATDYASSIFEVKAEYHKKFANCEL